MLFNLGIESTYLSLLYHFEWKIDCIDFWYFWENFIFFISFFLILNQQPASSVLSYIRHFKHFSIC